MTGVNPPAGESVLADLTTELVPDLTTELAEAEATQDRPAADAPAFDPPARRFSVYDTRLERYVTGVVTREAAEAHGPSKTGRYRLHELDTTGHLVRAALP